MTSTASSSETVGLIGLGAMGLGMAQSLRRKGKSSRTDRIAGYR